MIKKTLLSIVLVLISLTAAHQAVYSNVTKTIKKVTVINRSIEQRVFDVLVSGQDSVLVKNGSSILYTDVCGLDSSMARLVVAQAMFESDAFRSPLAIYHNNLYGMTHPGRGKLTTSLGPFARAEGRCGYASYKTIEHSVIDLVLWIDYNKLPHNVKTVSRYARLLKDKHYYETSIIIYTQGLNHHLTHVNNCLQKSL